MLDDEHEDFDAKLLLMLAPFMVVGGLSIGAAWQAIINWLVDSQLLAGLL